MSGKHVIVHVGYEKTGSSAVQEALASGASGDAAYAVTGRSGAHHYDLYAGLASGAPEMLDRLVAEVRASSASDLIVSCEHFSFHSVQSDGALTRLLNGLREADFAVTAVAVVREPYSYLTSLYSEGLKWGEVRAFEDFAAASRAKLWPSHLAGLVADQDIKFRFVKYIADPRFLARSVARAFGLGDTIYENWLGKEANVQLPPCASAALLDFNRMTRRPELTRKYVRFLDRWRDSFAEIEAPRSYTDTLRVSAETARAIQTALLNDEVSRRLFIDGAAQVEVSAGVLVSE